MCEKATAQRRLEEEIDQKIADVELLGRDVAEVEHYVFATLNAACLEEPDGVRTKS